MNDKRTKRPRLIPDAECVQSKCACMTTGCWDQCNLRRNPVFLAGLNHTSDAYSIIASPCQAGSISYDLQFAHLMGAYLDARLRKNGSTDVSKEFEAICAYIDARSPVAAAPDPSARDAALEEAYRAADAIMPLDNECNHRDPVKVRNDILNAINRLIGKPRAAPESAEPSADTARDAEDAARVMEMELALYRDAYGAKAPSDALVDVIDERQRQIGTKGWTPKHDDEHPCGEIAAFAAVYAMPPAARDWLCVAHMGYGDTLGEALCPEDWMPKFGDRRRELVKAGALIIAEIERLDRATSSAAKGAT